MNNLTPRIAINDLRKKFGEVEAKLPFVDHFIITKKGKPFAKISATAETKRDVLMSLAGAWKGTDLDDDELWKDVLKRKSRKKSIDLDKALRESFGVIPDFPDVAANRHSRLKPLNL